MKIIYASDIHADPEHLFSMLTIAEKEKVSGIIIGGDIIPHYLPDTQKVGVLKAQEIYLEISLSLPSRNSENGETFQFI